MRKSTQRLIELLAGLILITPALISVLLFIYAILFEFDYTDLLELTLLGIGDASAFSVFYGLMAIAGAYLIKDSQEKK